MAANANRFSTYTSVSTGSGSKNDNASTTAATAGDRKKDLWNSLLDSVATGRKLLERNLLVLGGSVESQREFLESLSLAINDPRRGAANNSSAGLDRQQAGARMPPVANNFALGYTYYDVLDADQEDILARMSLYLLSKPSPAFSSLVQPLLTPQSIPNTLIVILLDWAQPWRWLRQLREWILLLRTVLVSLSPECKEVMVETMDQWRERGRGGSVNLDGTTAAVDGDALPPGPGEWEDALGLPLCVVCQNAEKTDILERDCGWKDDDFDLVLQYLRTVLVKHGASLIYTTPNVPSQLPTLVHACLGVTSLLKRQPLKPEVIKRTEVIVPSNWDSWTKVLVVREGFEVDNVSNGWSLDLQRPFPANANGRVANGTRRSSGTENNPRSPDSATAAAVETDRSAVKSGEYSYDGPGEDESVAGEEENPNSAVYQYEQAVRDPGRNAIALAGQVGLGVSLGEGAADDLDGRDTEEEEDDDDDDGDSLDGSGAPKRDHQRRRRRRRRGAQRLEVETEDIQAFLAEQNKLLEQLRQKDLVQREKNVKESAHGRYGGGMDHQDGFDPSEAMTSQIGPVQFNIGGIQVDAEDIMTKIRDRHALNDPVESKNFHPLAKVPAASSGDDKGDGSAKSEKVDTEKMTAFFAGLMNRPSHTGKT